MSQLCPKALITLALRCATSWDTHVPSTILHIYALLNRQPLMQEVWGRVNSNKKKKTKKTTQQQVGVFLAPSSQLQIQL